MENHASVTELQKVVFLIPLLLTFGGCCSRYFWDIRLKTLRLPNFNMFFQLVLTKFFKSELFSCLPKVDHVIKSCKEPITEWHMMTYVNLRPAPHPRRPRDDRMLVVKVYSKIFDRDLTVNFHHEHSIVPTNCPWVSLGEKNSIYWSFSLIQLHQCQLLKWQNYHTRDKNVKKC